MFLLITSLIFNGFSIRKKFWKAETQFFSTIASYFVYIEDYYDLRHLWHRQYASQYTAGDGVVGKPYVPAFQNFLRIGNPLNIKEVMSKKMFVILLNFFWSLWSIIHIYHNLRHLQHESNYIAFDPLLRYFTSSTSATWIQCIRQHCQRCQRFCTRTAHSGFLVI